MDPFLPGEIPVMVLRYLAANKCESAALAMIEEMPLLKAHIPPKPPKVSNGEYLRYLARPSVNSSLKYVLDDYGNSKLAVEDILESENIDVSFSSDTLLSKINSLRENIKSGVGSAKSSSPVQSIQPVPAVVVPMVEASVNTDADTYKCADCLSRNVQLGQMSDAGCQTEEYTAVQFGLQDEIPRIFYTTLLGDNDLQQKIAQTINEHIQEGNIQGEQHEQVVQKISSKAESEIDKFLVDLLQDSNSMQSDLGLQQFVGPVTFSDVDANLSNILKDADLMFDQNEGAAPDLHCGEKLEVMRIEDTEGCKSKFNNNQTIVTPLKLNPNPTTSTVNATTSSSSSSSSSQTTTSTSTSSSGTSNSSSSNTFQSNSSVTKTPQKTFAQQSVKRITPTPVPPAAIAPAIFNSSVVVERKVVDFGDTTAKCAVTVANIQQPAWEKLNRRTISPKLPNSTSKPRVISNVKVKRSHTETALNLDPEATPVVPTPNKITTPSINTIGEPPNVPHVESIPVNLPNETPKEPTTVRKRKATPVKLTPEKAKSYNFIHAYHDPGSAAKREPLGSVVKSTPVAAFVNNSSLVDSKIINEVENSQSDCTPMQQILPPTSTLKTISPNALQRLIFSAGKLGYNPPPAVFNRKKSYSTPRKRKHVRNLTFTTPPSLKTAAQSHDQKQISYSDSNSSKKRKASDDVSLTADMRSKKRLNWPECEKKGNDVHLPNSTSNLGNPNSPMKTNLTEDSSCVSKNSSQPSAIGSSTLTAPIVNIAPTMPTILEESMTGSRGATPNQSFTTYPSEIPQPIQTLNASCSSGKQKEFKNASQVSSLSLNSNKKSNLESKTKGRKNTTKVKLPKKVNPTFHDLFGSPFKSEPEPEPLETDKHSKKKKDKRPVDVIAAQAVASQAVPLGKGKESQSPQKNTQILKNIDIPSLKVSPIKNTEIATSLPVEQNQTTSSSILPPSATKSDNFITFHIVPPPLGFPDPTPRKFPFENSFHMQNFNRGFNSPLITPLKAAPPAFLDETIFTLPPTPRVIEDFDTNSNSMHSLKLLYNQYNVGHFTSTPLKPGIPKTPGRESNSSNSRSPIRVQNPGAVTETYPPIIELANETIAASTGVATSAVTAAATTAVLENSPSREEEVAEKSEGELSSSEEDDTAQSQKSKKNAKESRKPSQKAENVLSSGSTNSNNKLAKSSLEKPTITAAQVPTVGCKLKLCSSPKQGLVFKVGGRGKALTISEQETLYSLLHMGNTPVLTTNDKHEWLTRPVATVSGIPNNPTNSAGAALATSHSSEDVKRPTQQQHQRLVKNKSVMDLIKFVHRKNQSSNSQQPQNTPRISQ